jgi:hypothetical protein
VRAASASPTRHADHHDALLSASVGARGNGALLLCSSAGRVARSAAVAGVARPTMAMVGVGMTTGPALRLNRLLVIRKKSGPGSAARGFFCLNRRRRRGCRGPELQTPRYCARPGDPKNFVAAMCRICTLARSGRRGGRTRTCNLPAADDPGTPGLSTRKRGALSIELHRDFGGRPLKGGPQCAHEFARRIWV